MFHFLKDTRFDYGDLTFNPPQEDYLGFATVTPPIPGTVVSMQVRSPTTRKFDADYVIANRGILCSHDLKRILEQLDTGILFYKAQVIWRDGKIIEKEYFLMHISEHRDCLSYESSRFKDREAFIASGEKDVDVLTHFDFIDLDKNKIGNARCFYISNSPFPYMPVVSNDIATKLLLMRLKGVSVLPVSEYVWNEFSG